MQYSQISYEERIQIDVRYNVDKWSARKIADELKRSHTTISREIKRNSINGEYFFEDAEFNFFKRMNHKYMFRLHKYQEFTNKFIELFDKKRHSIKWTTWKIKSMNFCKCPTWRQVFNWIKSWKWVLNPRDRLKRYYVKGGKRKVGDVGRIWNKYLLPYGARGKKINSRATFGHWELDLINGKQESGRHHIATLVERKTRYGITFRVRSKHPFKFISLLWENIKKQNLFVKSITLDNGIEFCKIAIAAKWGRYKAYLCEPYCSFQRGTNENWNGMYRRYAPKGTDFTYWTDEEIEHATDLVNTTPREILGFRTSAEVYLEEIRNLRTN